MNEHLPERVELNFVAGDGRLVGDVNELLPERVKVDFFIGNRNKKVDLSFVVP